MTNANAGLPMRFLGLEDGWTPGAFGRDLRVGEGTATTFLPALPRDEDQWRSALREAQQRRHPLRAGLAEALRARNAALEMGPATEQAIDALSDDAKQAVCVVTGQQPGLFGGPWLTAYKLAGAVHLSRRLAALGEGPVVPVFWLASEDHDFDEANRAGVVGRDGALHTLKVDVQATGQSIGHVDVPHALREAVMERLEGLLPETDRAAVALDALRPREGEDFATWCLRPLLALFEGTGLVVVEPLRMPELLAEDMSFLLEHGATIVSAVRKTGAALRAADLPAPLEPGEDDLPLFLRPDPQGRRERIRIDASGQVFLRDRASGMDRQDLATCLTEAPARFSGNVIGRVFTQNRLLPVLAYVAGPSEIAYQAQVAAAHQALALPFPWAVPRPEATWVLPRQREKAEAFGLGIDDLLLGGAPSVDDESASLDDVIDATRAQLLQAFETLRDPLSGGRGRDAVERLEKRVAAAFDKGVGGLRSAHDADQGIGRARWERLVAWLRPQGKPQERIHVPVGITARYGLPAAMAGLTEMDPLPCRHVIFEAESPDA